MGREEFRELLKERHIIASKALKKAHESWFLIDTKFFDTPVNFGLEVELEPFDTKDAVYTVTHGKTFSKKGE